MRALPKNHIYNLYLRKETQYLMEFRNHRTYSIALGTTLVMFFWLIYLVIILPMPETVPLKTPLSFGIMFMGGFALLGLFYFVSAYENLVLRKVNRSVEYECHSPGGRMGWKKRFGDFRAVRVYPAAIMTPGGKLARKPPVWRFELVGADERRVPINPPGRLPLNIYQEEEAYIFAQKIARFMEIEVEKPVLQEDTEGTGNIQDWPA